MMQRSTSFQALPCRLFFSQIALGPKIRFEVKLQVCTYCYFGDESITRKGNFFNNDHHQGIVRTGAMVAWEPGEIWQWMLAPVLFLTLGLVYFQICLAK